MKSRVVAGTVAALALGAADLCHARLFAAAQPSHAAGNAHDDSTEFLAATPPMGWNSWDGYGLTVTEAMWKGTPVIAGNVGGIPHQIQSGVNGFLVSSVEECAHRIVELLKNRRLREHIGRTGKETVRQKFLMPRFLEQHLDLFSSFESSFRHVGCCARSTWSPEQRKLFCP